MPPGVRSLNGNEFPTTYFTRPSDLLRVDLSEARKIGLALPFAWMQASFPSVIADTDLAMSSVWGKSTRSC